jgi:hypothetical protein
MKEIPVQHALMFQKKINFLAFFTEQYKIRKAQLFSDV